ncbi:hypothetical protein DOM21_16005 [Bacteriovorax stolpii]|uniref:sensor histidine kinase n=1 Tax=Bacteriovorax stolpii TaxID=960 RepID=UPI00115AA882|nr:histidine kinase N-terminal 7TM domain-containing protein [Bacteriovorax stolpii]QDK42927.1 hypothetical protein DOM21_16005 [Bacteriovorax stolpii]
MPILFNVLHWISGLILISLSFYCLKKASNKLGLYLCFFLFLLSVWSLGAALIFNVHSLDLKIDLMRLRQVGICMIPVSLLYLIRSLGDYKPLPLYVKISLFIAPCVSILTIISPYHEYFIKEYEVRSIYGFNVLTFHNGPIFFFNHFAARVTVLWSLFLLMTSTKRQNHIQQHYNWILFTSILVPFAIDTVAVALSPTLRYLQIVPVFLTLSALCFCYIILKGEVLKIVPVARGLILDSISDIYISLDQKNKIVDFNACAKQQLQLNDSSYGKNLSDLPFNKFISHITAAIEDGKPSSEFFLNYKTYKEYYFITIEDILANNNTFAGRIIIIKNITEQKNYEIQLTQMAEIRTKFISVMAHDLIGNVASHTLLVESLMDHPAIQEDEDLKASLSLLHDSSQNVTKFVEGLLRWSKDSLEKIQLKTTQVDLYDLIDEAILYLSPISMQKDIGYTLNIQKNTSAKIDVNMIQTVVRNLISNAIKYSPQNGNIHIEATMDAELVTITISDEGPGVNEMEMNQFLSRFHMKSYKGGLGLTLCRDFVHLHKGEIKAQNKNPNGTVFSFALPVT